MRLKLTLLACITLYASPAWADEPALPIGLGSSNEPSLPTGLQSDEPSLPTGLGSKSSSQTDADTSTTDWRENLPFDLNGFAETRLGTRLKSDPTQKQTSIGEGRLHLEALKSWEQGTSTFITDFVYDPVIDRHRIDLENGQGWLDLREANHLLRPTDFSDVKIGRQILTWGTGDLLFINDLFPKDWNSFFIGRDEEYLKAPSDAVKVALFHDIANLDIVYTPQFDADRFIDGRRISYYNKNAGRVVGRNQIIHTDKRSSWFRDNEIALRLHRLIETYETAIYFYNGYWKSPGGQDVNSGLYTFPHLSVYGASVRGPLGAGILSTEIGYYDSRDNRSGTNAFINNSEFRFLVGYEQEIWTEMTANVQYYQEWIQDYRAYRNSLPAGSPIRDRHRHVLTLRLTQLLMNQNLTLSFFTFYSPSDKDGYLRPIVTYKLDDHWTGSIGGNLFFGQKRQTFFGQFKDNTNVYASVRYGF